MPGEISAYPFVNTFPKTKQLPLLQSFANTFMHVLSLDGHPALCMKMIPLDLPYFVLPEYICMYAGIYLCTKIVVYVQVFMCAKVWKYACWDWKQPWWEGKIRACRCNYVDFSQCPNAQSAVSYVGLGRHLHLSLKIWAWLGWHLHNPRLPGTKLCWPNSNTELTIYDGVQMPGTSNWFPAELVSCLLVFEDLAQKLLAVKCLKATCCQAAGSRDKDQQAGHHQLGDHGHQGCSSLAWWCVCVCTNHCLTSGWRGRTDVGECLQKSMRL